MFCYVNGDVNKSKFFQLQVADCIKPFMDDSWMLWGLEIVSDEIRSAYSKWMEDNVRDLPDSFGRHNVGEVDWHVDLIIETMWEDYFKQHYWYGSMGIK